MLRFSALGIPVTVDPWFLIGLFFISQWSGGGRVGLFAAAALAVLTLIHELGHALVARRHGCAVSIRLNLFVGWASYASPKPLTSNQQISISLAGPLSQLFAGLVALAGVHTMFHRAGSNAQLWADMWFALAWAGVAIAMLNLLPLWPLDGSHVVNNLIARFTPERRALRATLLVSVGGIVGLLIVGLLARNGSVPAFERERVRAVNGLYELGNPSLPAALWGQFRALPLYVLDLPWFLLIFSGLATFQTLQRVPRHDRVAPWIDIQEASTRLSGAPGDPALADPHARQLEYAGWLDATLPGMPRGWDPSPWLRAHVALAKGDEGGARAALMKVVASGGPRWVLPDPANPDLGPLAQRLPDPLPVDDHARSLTLLRVLAHHGPPERLLNYATAVYGQFRDPEAFFIAAGGLALRNLPDDAMSWLRRATFERPDHQRVATDPDLSSLHTRLDFQQLLVDIRNAPR